MRRRKITLFLNAMQIECLKILGKEMPKWANDAATIATVVTGQEAIVKVIAAFDAAPDFEKSDPGHFAICAEMARRNLDIRLSMLDNVSNVQYNSKRDGTIVTIGVSGNLVAAIGLDNKFVGGLLLCDRKQYFQIADELKRLDADTRNQVKNKS